MFNKYDIDDLENAAYQFISKVLKDTDKSEEEKHMNVRGVCDFVETVVADIVEREAKKEEEAIVISELELEDINE